jgi:peptide/nickel transport system substrate-binding protein
MPSACRLVISLVVSAVLLVTSCDGSSGNGSLKRGVGGSLTIANATGARWSCGFNPFNASMTSASFGIIYEPLIYTNLLNDSKTPWLASSYEWGDDTRSLTFTIRPGVKWTDGQDFSAADVVFTFDLLKQNLTLDLQSVWSALSDVIQVGNDKVTMTFLRPAASAFYRVAGQVPIVPKHIWSGIKNPLTEKNTIPVGTGPFTLSQCTPQNIAYVRNPGYWQKGLPYLNAVNYPAFTDNDAANAQLIAGEAQWGGQFVPNIDTEYVSKDPDHNHYWFPPINNVNLWINTKLPPLNNKAVRQAMAYGIDRVKVSQMGEYGYEPPGNQTGVLIPTFQDWVDQAQAAKYDYRFDPAKAAAVLEAAGFTKDSSGIFRSSAGKRLSFKVINIGGYTDWVVSLDVIKENLKEAGIEIIVQNLSSQQYFDSLFRGRFELAYGSVASPPGPAPYFELRNTLHSGSTAALGALASGNYGRYENPQVDALFDEYDATTDPLRQHEFIARVQAIMLDDVPVIPVTEGVAWYEWTTKGLAGWPTPEDQYAAPAPWNLPDWEVVLLHVYKTA